MNEKRRTRKATGAFSKLAAAVVLLATASPLSAQVVPQIVKLYQGVAPGSEHWSIPESTFESGYGKVTVNVSSPTLEYFPAKKELSSGAAVMVLPGGAMHMLDLEFEGTVLAQFLADAGVSAFVLKYRLVQTTDLEKQMAEALGTNYEKTVGDVMALAKDDALVALDYVRKNSALYGVDRNKIGILGFSAGAQVAMAAAYASSELNRPNFVAAVYGTATLRFLKAVPKARMPAFFVVASDDDLGAMPYMVEQYKYWLSGGQKAELHLYQEGKHGFGMRKFGITTDGWNAQFLAWIRMNQF